MSNNKELSETSENEELESSIQEAKTAYIENNFEKTIEILVNVLESQNNTTKSEEIEIKYVEAYYYYGLALFNVAIQARDILAVNRPGSEENESDDNSKLDEEKASNNSNDEDEEDDMGLAWQMLELARKTYEKNNIEDKYLINIIDLHVVLGDISLENESYERSIEDYDKALEYINDERLCEMSIEQISRRKCEIHFKKCLSFETCMKYDDAKLSLNLAIDEIDKAIKSLEKLESNDEKEENLEGIKKDLLEKQEEIMGSIRDHENLKELLKKSLTDSIMKKTNEDNDDELKDLGVVGRGKKRIHVNNVDDDDEKEKKLNKKDHE